MKKRKTGLARVNELITMVANDVGVQYVEISDFKPDHDWRAKHAEAVYPKIAALDCKRMLSYARVRDIVITNDTGGSHGKEKDE